MVMPSASGITLVKVEGWYDNEWGYANRLVDLSLVVGVRRLRAPGSGGAEGR